MPDVDLPEINDYQLHVYISEVDFQVDQVIVAANVYNTAIIAGRSQKQLSPEVQGLLILSVTALINAAAKISKLIFPRGLPKPEKVKSDDLFRVSRGNALQEALVLTESPLQNKKHRNYLEHFDEEIDARAGGKDGKSYTSIAFGNAITPRVKLDNPAMRLIDIENGLFLAKELRFDIQETISAAEDIKQRIVTYRSK